MQQKSTTPLSAEERAHLERSQLAGTITSLVGWVVVVLPIILMSLLIFAEVLRPDRGMWHPASLALMFGGALLLLCMVTFPHFVGQAVRFREKAMLRAALITGIPTAAVVLFFVVRWIANLAA